MKIRTLIIIILLLAVAVLWGVSEARGRSVAEARADSAKVAAERAHRSVDSLKRVEAALRERYTTDTLYLTRWRTRWDSIRVTDSVPVEVIIRVADSTIQACEVVRQTCEERVAVVTERADSAASEATHWQEAAKQWEKIARGPFIRLGLEGTVTPSLDWQAAGDVTIGRGRLKALARVDVGPGVETCAFQPNVEAYSCSTPIEGTVRLGARWTP